MPVTDSSQRKPFFDLYGMKVKVADIMPKGALFGFKSVDQPTRWFGLDPADPDGDGTAVVEIKPSYTIESLDLLDDRDWGIADYTALERRALHLAADIEQSRRHAAYGTSAADPNYTRTFRFDDFQRIMKDFMERDCDIKTKLIEALLTSGFDVRLHKEAPRPIAIFPESYRASLTEARERLRDGSEKMVWPERYVDLRESMSLEEFRRLHTQEWPHPESEGKA